MFWMGFAIGFLTTPLMFVLACWIMSFFCKEYDDCRNCNNVVCRCERF